MTIPARTPLITASPSRNCAVSTVCVGPGTPSPTDIGSRREKTRHPPQLRAGGVRGQPGQRWRICSWTSKSDQTLASQLQEQWLNLTERNIEVFINLLLCNKLFFHQKYFIFLSTLSLLYSKKRTWRVSIIKEIWHFHKTQTRMGQNLQHKYKIMEKLVRKATSNF